MDKQNNTKLETAIFAGGCFWCTEAVFQRLNGVEEVASGYTGGDIKNPAYREICTGRTGHAEGIRITFDPTKIAYEELLEVFFATHDPTTLNRQGNDVGTQYRSEIFYTTEAQKQRGRGIHCSFGERKYFRETLLLPRFRNKNLFILRRLSIRIITMIIPPNRIVRSS